MLRRETSLPDLKLSDMAYQTDNDLNGRVSKALWIPIIWFFIAGTRPISSWLNMGTVVDSTDKYLDGSPVDRNILTVLIVAALFVLISRSQKVIRVLNANGPIVLFLFYCAASIVWSEFRDVAFKRWIRALGDVSMIMVVLTDPRPAAAIRKFFLRSCYLILPACLMFDIVRTGTGRAWHYGLTLNKNMYGLIGMVLAIGAVWLFIQDRRAAKEKGRKAKLYAPGTLVVIAVVCLWSANSVTSLSCFLLGAMILIISTGKGLIIRRPGFVHVLVVSLILLAIYSSLINPNLGIVSAMGKDPTLTGRTLLWPSVIAMNPNPLIGAGFESFWLGERLTALWNTFVWHPNEAHDGYIEIYLNLGWVGLILMGVVVFTGYRSIIQAFRRDPLTYSLNLAFFVVVMVYNLTEAGFRIFTPAWIVFLLSVMSARTMGREANDLLPAGVQRPSLRVAGLNRHGSGSSAGIPADRKSQLSPFKGNGKEQSRIPAGEKPRELQKTPFELRIRSRS